MKKLDYPDFSKVPTVQDQIDGVKKMNDRIKTRYKTFQCTFRKGWKPKFVDSKGLLQAMDFDGEGAIHIEQYGNMKSNRQNDYFRGVFIPHFLKALRNAGYGDITTNEDALEVMKGIFFKKNELEIKGEYIPRYLSTKNSEWPKDLWELKLQAIRAWTNDRLGYDIPPPNEPDLNEKE
jgi:hypothetical protein